MFPLLPPPTITICHFYKGLVQTPLDYKLLSTSAQGTSVQGCVRDIGICLRPHMALRKTEVSLKPASSGIITPF